MERMGDKIAAKAAAREAGLPVLEGSDGPVLDVREAVEAAERAGFPVLLKAAAGGGGKGMRRVERPGDLAQAFEVAQREAEAAFNDGSLYVERLLEGARHVEIQVMADGLGGALVCGDRECSIQRRHQKLIEEASAPHLPDATREAMQQAALRACKAWNYRSAGTLEFLVDAAGDFFFLELNARLQVEHPVTELVTGLDLVAEQLTIAAGGLLSRTGVAEARGHAIECRINAEDPSRDFRPGAGRLDDFRIAQGPGIRVDTHCEPGEAIPPYYDSLLGKLCVWASDRPRAVARMRRALSETSVTGIATTLPLLRDIAHDAPFVEGRYTTAYLTEREAHLPSLRADRAA
jgi:acetyl-CoA carboxylase biotin carboxylase subunit